MTIPRSPFLPAALSGLLLALAFPSHPGHPLSWLYGPAWAWIGLTPLLVVLVATQRRRRGFGLAWVAGFCFHMPSLYWIGHTQGGGPAVVAGAALGAAYLSLFTGLFGAAVVQLRRHLGAGAALLAAPLAWTAMEYLLSLGELGFPWLLLGHAQAPWPAVLQHATVTGVYGVSFVVAATAALVAGAVRFGGRTRWRCLAAGATVPVVTAIGGAWAMAPEAGPTVRVAVVQNAMGRAKWQPGGLQASLQSLDQLSRQAAGQSPDLVVWPETAVPCNLGWRADCRQRVRAIAEQIDAPILTGAPDTDPETGEPLNGAFLIRPGVDEVLSYAKMHLVPFGERTPFRDRIPFLRDIDWAALTGDLGPAEFAPGRRRTLFPLEAAAGGEPARFAVLVCFESVFPDLVRRAVDAGAHLLVNITNDSWFGPTAGPFQHADINVLRAVENRTAIARCATDGISLFIDRYGRARERTRKGSVDLRVGDLALRSGTTFYTRHGDLFAGVALAVTGLLLAGGGRLRPWLQRQADG